MPAGRRSRASHQYCSGLLHGEQEIVAAVAPGRDAGDPSVVFLARRLLGGQARRFAVRAVALGLERLGRVLGRLERLQLRERGRHFAARDESGHLRLLQRGPAGVGLRPELCVRGERRLHGRGGCGRGVGDGVVERRPARAAGRVAGGSSRPRVRPATRGAFAVLGEYVVLGHGRGVAQPVAPVVGQRRAVVAEEVERI